MSTPRKILLIRHGETAWTLSGQHTGVSDIPLTDKGLKEAVLVAARLKKFHFQKVLTSSLERAKKTAEISGLKVEVDPDLAEWNYGDYDGLTRDQIWQRDPNWCIFTKGAPNGESVEAIRHRADRVIAKINAYQGDMAIFSHGHFLRALASRWIQQPISLGQHLMLVPASISILSYERATPAILLWNDISHLNINPQ